MKVLVGIFSWKVYSGLFRLCLKIYLQKYLSRTQKVKTFFNFDVPFESCTKPNDLYIVRKMLTHELRNWDKNPMKSHLHEKFS